MNGILNILKPPNMTSHDMVSLIRRKLNIKKVGHTGTLDPMATGVLPICIGKATKVVDFIQSDAKIYRAELTLGSTTDTQDKWGTVLETENIMISEKKIYETFNSFVGTINQTPPMYSALKYKGQKLYDLARQGITIERKSRKIRIYYINILNIENNKILFDVKCSKGTYIRTLCHDIGQTLKCGGHMSFLARLQSGIFKLEETITVEELMNASIEMVKNNFLINIDYPLYFLPKVDVYPSALKYLLNGVPLRVKDYYIDTNISLNDNEIVRLYVNNNFLALGKYINNNNPIIKIKKLFS